MRIVELMGILYEFEGYDGYYVKVREAIKKPSMEQLKLFGSRDVVSWERRWSGGTEVFEGFEGFVYFAGGGQRITATHAKGCGGLEPHRLSRS